MHKFFSGIDRQLIVLIFLLSPLFVINITDQHDWGDDFAQYLDQAKDLINGEFQTGNEVIFSEYHGPSIRGAGFSLFLAPIYFFSAQHMVVYSYAIALCLLFCTLLFYQLLKRYTTKWVAVLVALAFAYNYHILRFKLEIMPEFLFTGLTVLFFLISTKPNARQELIGLILGLIISVKVIGVLVLLAWVLSSLLKGTTAKMNIAKVAGIAGVTFLAIQLVVVRQLSLENITWYWQHGGEISTEKANTIAYYFRIFKEFFEQEVWGWANVMLKGSAVLLLIAGAFIRRRSWSSPIGIYLILYLALLLLYPNTDSGMRFMIPIFPVLILLMIIGVQKATGWNTTISIYIPVLFWCTIILSNYINVKNIINADPMVQNGPYSPNAQCAFQWIERNTSDKVVVATNKPWAAHLLTGRTTVPLEALCYEKESLKNADLTLLKATAGDQDPNGVLKCNLKSKYYTTLLWEGCGYSLEKVKY